MIILTGLLILTALGIYTIVYPEFPKSKQTQPRKLNGQYTNNPKKPTITVNDLRESVGLDRGY